MAILPVMEQIRYAPIQLIWQRSIQIGESIIGLTKSWLFLVGSIQVILGVTNDRLVGIPTVPFTATPHASSYSFRNIKSIIVDSKYASSVNTAGETLIPPTLLEFATTFSEDVESKWGMNLDIVQGTKAIANSIFITIGNNSAFVDVAGRWTGEAYALEVSDGITITGASPLGAWWGTRSILQQAVLGDMTMPQGNGVDSPRWANRGFMIDAGRHYYPKEWIIEMCSYLSFFKQNTFHLHLGDNLYNNVDIYTLERSKEIYAAFRLNSNSEAVAGLSRRYNESYYENDFEEMQQKCAARGVTIIPELEAPGHAMAITQWKPEIALSADFSMLNITHPDTIPIMQTIWGTFLPWIHSKTVHIGADEYQSGYREDYNYFVNTMADYIYNISGKATRIWGTFPPELGENNIQKTVTIQHWEYFEDNPLTDYIDNNYSVLNSDDKFYMVGKWSGSYPQTINISRIFHGQQDGGPYAPWVFDTSNATDNPSPNNPYILGQLAALWNDHGPNSTVISEAYYSIRDGLPPLGDKQWGGDLLAEEYYEIFDALHAAIPAQNLDSAIASKTNTILKYTSAKGGKVEDLSGNGYSGTIVGDCEYTSQGFKFNGNGYIETPLVAKGRNYTLSFSVKPETSSPGTLFNSSLSTLSAGNGTISNVTFIAGGNAYSLNYSLPVGQWSDVSVIGRDTATYFLVENNGTQNMMEFTTKIGVNGEYFVWAVMAIEAPLTTIGAGFRGLMKNITLLGRA
ncbi:beta-hexosaminidase [Coleophoma cylindrospora]|uniref:beta-N-acetylhexosaminidase n=1 Tax=Coleophoma cylindrospora TaxID=1849047 RepID=A0A3D8STZ1_9HELO|nr:beta-hexosaminidase [Coleophoma cylindrospora]